MDGTTRSAPIAEVQVTTPFYNGELRALAVENPIADVIIGNIDGASEKGTEEKAAIGAVQTRKAAMKQRVNLDEYEEAIKEIDGGDKRISLMEFSTAEIKEAQENDKSLVKAWEKAETERPVDRDNWLTVKNGLLYRMKEHRNGSGTAEQLVAPQKFRNKIMEIAHEGVFEGHLGTGRTLDKIMQSFFGLESVQMFSGTAAHMMHAKRRPIRVDKGRYHYRPRP
ncbi:zinc finger protein [Elysia marginata]|uniref:Zinc finger protein n=1 Tax=Elysia marginata TaxID=1093978 RepID=A0AAV4GSR6_9GAST|nr:zinc finger protein [Elysia marginata]